MTPSTPHQRPRSPDIAVVGGGVIGCAIAHALAARGLAVAVYERGAMGREATWAAGGMLSPLGEKLSPDPFLSLGLESLRLYPDFLDAVRAASGVPVELIRCGKILVAFDEARRAALTEHGRNLSDQGFAARWLDADALRAEEPGITERAVGALSLDGEGQVENRILAQALSRAAAAAGAHLHEGVDVRAVRTCGGRVDGLLLADGTRVAAGTVVIAAGAWSGKLGGLPRPLPVRPVRGQMLAMAAASVAPRSIVETEEVYLIPRPDGRVVVGSTMEEVGFDGSTTPEAIEEIERAAVQTLPLLADTEIEEAWAGLRPGTPDDLPILGPDPGVDGLIYATGHFRNGILLAPVTAAIVADLIVQGRSADSELTLFDPGRFVDASLVR